MNYMKQVAQMLGVELDEEFYLKGDNHIYKFSTNRLLCLADNKKWIIATLTLTLILTGKREIVKKPILDEVERKYLSNIVKPFRNKVIYIIKFSNANNHEYIGIRYYDDDKTMNQLIFPNFEKNSMYKGMKANKKYTLEELGL